MVINVSDAISAYQQSMDGEGVGGKKKTGGSGDAEGAGSFSSTLAQFVGDGLNSVKEAEKMTAAGAVGKANLQDVILAVNNAELQMQTVTSIRDKVIGAYEDMIRMQI